VFIGDGASDRFAAAHADLVFAKGALARTCAAEGWPFVEWESFGPVAAWIDQAFEQVRLPRSAAEFDQWRGKHGAAPRPFICGPEVWGPGRTTPGPGPRGR
jgi:hypothetical protein